MNIREEITTMKKMYHLEYEENEETFADMYLMYYNSRSKYMYKFIVTMVGVLFLFIRFFAYRSSFDVPYVMKYLVLWALAYVLGYLLEKHVLRKSNCKQAERT